MENIFYKDYKPLRGEEVVVGIDEAGRGPVLGYLVYGLLISTPVNISKYEFKDSKALPEIKRKKLFQEIQNDLPFSYFAVSPNYLNKKMNEINLNQICVETVITLIESVVNIYNIKTIYIDTIGTAETLRKVLTERFKLHIVVESKADSKYKIVSGASIVAKVTRDRLISEYSTNIGSGYPADPVTIEWLKRNFDNLKGFPVFVRNKWKTLDRFYDKRKGNELKGTLKGFFNSKE